MPRTKPAPVRYYLLIYGTAYGDHWGYSEAVCSGEHPLEWVERARTDPKPQPLRLVSWGEISREEFDRFALIVRA